MVGLKIWSGMMPICAWCKKIKNDEGYWNQIESYIRDHSEVEFSHSICPDCAKKLYPDVEISPTSDFPRKRFAGANAGWQGTIGLLRNVGTSGIALGARGFYGRNGYEGPGEAESSLGGRIALVRDGISPKAARSFFSRRIAPRRELR